MDEAVRLDLVSQLTQIKDCIKQWDLQHSSALLRDDVIGLAVAIRK